MKDLIIVTKNMMILEICYIPRMTDRYGNDLSELDEDFDLYNLIARNVRSAQLKGQLNKKIRDEFIIEEDEISEPEFVYKF